MELVAQALQRSNDVPGVAFLDCFFRDGQFGLCNGKGFSEFRSQFKGLIVVCASFREITGENSNFPQAKQGVGSPLLFARIS